MKFMRGLCFAFLFTVAFGGFIWGATVFGKWMSYKFFYESQVRETIHVVLHEEGLR